MAKKKQVILTREEELRVLRERNEKIRANPKVGFKMLQKAGIYDKDGQLTEKYRER